MPDPTPSRDGVVLKVRACGLCRSDWHGWKGHDPPIEPPNVPGDEEIHTCTSTRQYERPPSSATNGLA